MQTEKTFKNERLTYRLNIVAQEAIQANDEIFLRETGSRIRDLRVLRLIDDRPGTTFAEIAKTTGFERSLTSRIIQYLIGAGLIERENSSEDARVFLLSTTPKGKEVRQVARRLSDRLEVILTDPLSSQEMRALNEILARLGAWVTSEDYRNALANEPKKDAI
ncbi:MarR family winged helix-turn-helix transcriptional regulator [Primorskyibacter aestuariivivens]|uniref:MarR family winged helix-turn-helix transcriptional regulator n=1 Tax=Primorskyibacter aestuariivivens TaxID=1888912 RepID=UPI002300AFEB|nr:MarR family winged helix-turn-helix transcriptional regulator [Primorskyibacter aestuariivivens]MDA7429683.1 MarR family winged helix-turn-helix transcriptional regulator [Primorskyibacter aestuariivivens]